MPMLKSSTMLADFRKGPSVHDIRAGAYEFLGTTLFLFFAFLGCQTAASVMDGTGSTDAASELVSTAFCATSFALSLFVLVSVFFRVTGGVFNPSIALALFITSALRVWRFIIICVSQLLGSIVAAALLKGLHAGEISVNNKVAPGVGLARGVFLEAFTTGLLVFTVLMAAADKRIMASKVLAPLCIAAALYIGHMTTIRYTGTSMNPARSFGPAVIAGFPSSHWVFWVGPTIGSLVATGFYKYLQHTEYWRLGNCEDSASTSTHDEPILPLFHPHGKAIGHRQMGSTSTGCTAVGGASDLERGQAMGPLDREGAPLAMGTNADAEAPPKREVEHQEVVVTA